MDSEYGKPRKFTESEYKQYYSYLHMNEKSTEYIRQQISSLDESWSDTGIIAIVEDGTLVIEIPDISYKKKFEDQSDVKVYQLKLKKNDDDFIIFSTKGEQVCDININFLLMRIGGARIKGGLSAFKKNEFRIMIESEGDEPDIG